MPAGTPVYPGGSNTYIPNHRATNNLVIEYSRGVDEFPLNEYIKLEPVKQDQGFYLRITAEEAGRIIDADLSQFVWADGDDRPMDNDGTELFNFENYRTKRYDFGYKLGSKSLAQAEWNVGQAHEKIKAHQAMTGRTLRVHSILNNAASWDAGHSQDVGAMPGNSGAWDASTVARQDIKRSLNVAHKQIMLSTLSVVKRKRDMRLVMNPNTAQRISETQELVEHIKGSPEAYSQFAGDNKWSEYGIPATIYGYKVVIEDTVRVASRRGAATADRQFLMPDGVAYLLSRPGALTAKGAGGPNFSTICYMAYEEMTVQQKDDEWNRKIEGHVVDDGVPVLTASASGFRFEGVTT